MEKEALDIRERGGDEDALGAEGGNGGTRVRELVAEGVEGFDGFETGGSYLEDRGGYREGVHGGGGVGAVDPLRLLVVPGLGICGMEVLTLAVEEREKAW